MDTYNEYIQSILSTRGRFNCGDKYHERHHIVPKCIGGTNDDDNLIDLYAKEHFIAHKLLSEENPDNESLLHAYTMMAFVIKNDNQKRYELTPEEYEDARIKTSELNKKRWENEDYKKKMSCLTSERNKSLWKDEEYRNKHTAMMAETLSQLWENPDFVIKMQQVRDKNLKRFLFDEELSNKQKIAASNALKSLWENDEFRNKMKDVSKSFWTEDRKKEFGEKSKERWSNEEYKNKMAIIASETASRTLKQCWENEEYRNKKIKQLKDQWNDEEYKKMMYEKIGKSVIRLTDGKIYQTINEASADANVSRSTMRRWCKSYHNFMFYNDWLTIQK